jgi:hypothetical protein
LGEQKYLEDDLGCLWIVIRKGKEESAAVFIMHGNDAKAPPGWR